MAIRSTPTVFDASMIPGPIVVSGAGGFVGVHVLACLSAGRDDVIGFGPRAEPWRLAAAGDRLRYETVDHRDIASFLDRHRPKTIINLAAAGAYSFQTDAYRIPEVNIGFVDDLASWAIANDAVLIHAGSSSEYGSNCAGPSEEAIAEPNSLYAVTKLAATHLLADYSRRRALRARVMRLYSVYGPLEEPRRLIPEIVRRAHVGELPEFAARDTTRDFVFIDDVVDAFAAAALAAHDREQPAFRIYNVASGRETSMEDIATSVAEEFGITRDPVFSTIVRSWDLPHWYGDPARINTELGWRARVTFTQGLRHTHGWYGPSANRRYLEDSYSASAGPLVNPVTSPRVSAVIACYKDGQAIPIMHRRLVDVFQNCGVDYEIIFVNDASPDDSAAIIEQLSEGDDRVVGITHRRNFGSQAAFLSGMREATGDAVVLLDGDLQDPPEIIEKFLSHWYEGYEVVYGHRVDREAPWYMRLAYKGFYRIFNRSAPFRVPTDAGDFSLLDRRVVDHLLQFPERDLFLRALRAYVGGKQIGVDYVRPERMFGRSTNNLARNLAWAIKGILSVSRVPLSILATSGVIFFIVSMLTLATQVAYKIIRPDSAPQGITMLVTLVVLLGSLNLLAISIVGAYVGAVLEETKRRPRFLRDRIVRSGRVVESASDGHDHAGPSGSSRPHRSLSRVALPIPRSASSDDRELASVRLRDARGLPGP